MKKVLLSLIVVVSISLFWGCGEETVSSGNREHDGIETDETVTSKSVWDSSNIQNYSFTLEIMGFSPDRGSYQITVINDTVANVYNTANFANADISTGTIEDLFTLIERNEADSVVEVLCEFDSLLGFPTSISLSWGESMGYAISNFTDNTAQFDQELFGTMKELFTTTEPAHYRYEWRYFAGILLEERMVEVKGDSLYTATDTLHIAGSGNRFSVQRLYKTIEDYSERIGEHWWNLDDIYLQDLTVRYDSTTGIPLSVSPKILQTSIPVEDVEEGYSISNLEIIESN